MAGVNAVPLLELAVLHRVMLLDGEFKTVEPEGLEATDEDLRVPEFDDAASGSRCSWHRKFSTQRAPDSLGTCCRPCKKDGSRAIKPSRPVPSLLIALLM
eukprot:gb/GFBE01006194.1/.p1 GENE.gb/GFBE01006194.1/~~gb/GFBE01006194.1/.p1  ORF type:complete len:100 (+),score=17.75 gb/GFBE01006194.1/:1-300(+)